MRHYKAILIEKQEVDTVICNCCGKQIIHGKDKKMGEYLSVVKHWGYHSPFDGEKHSLDVCPECYHRWIQTFQFPPTEPAQAKEKEEVKGL